MSMSIRMRSPRLATTTSKGSSSGSNTRSSQLARSEWCSITDLSERKRNEQAEAALRMRDEFLAIASHELRTPLSTLILRLELLEHHAAKGDLAQVQTSVRRAQDQTERMRRLVDRLLDVSQLASGRLKLDLAPSDLGCLVKEVAERFSEDATNARCELRLKVTGGVNTQVDGFRLDEA